MPPERELRDRLPPQSLEAEQAVLGSMLRDPECIGDIVNIIRPDSCYSDAHQKICQAIYDLYDLGRDRSGVDLVLLADELKRRGQLEDVGGYTYLAGLWDAAPTAANAECYARIVRDRAMVRNLIHVSTEVLRDAYDQVLPADELLESAERRIMEVAQRGLIGQTMRLEQALQLAYDRLDRRHEGQADLMIGLATGFLDLDELTAGLQNSELIIVAARPSVGKTAFDLNLVRNVVLQAKAPVFFVSLEQSSIELAERLLVSQAHVDSHKLRKGHLSGEELKRLIDAGGELGKAPLFIDDAPGQGMLRIAANARRLKLR